MKYFIIFLFLASFITHYVFAENTIRINEFIIEPTPEQVEIINIGTESADISGWIIDDNGGTTYYTIPQSSILYPNACLVFSGDFNLNKSSADTIRLFNSGNLIDSFSYKSSSGSGISYLRLPDGTDNWTTKSASLGLFNEGGLSCIVTPTQIPSPTITPTPTIEQSSNEIISITPSPVPTFAPTIAPTSYQNIYISEAMASPPSDENEWVELFNNNDFSVFLTGWFIDDIENAGSSPKVFSIEIQAKSFGVVDISSSMFNNSGDSVRLLDFNKIRIDDFEYASTTQGKTLGRVSYDSDEFCFQEPSKGNANNSCINPTPTQQPTPTKTPTPVPTRIPILISQAKPALKTALTNGSFNTNNNLAISANQLTGEGEILGISEQYQNNKNNKLIKSLSFISFFYSLLTILSLFLKMKKGYEKSRRLHPSSIYSEGNE